MSDIMERVRVVSDDAEGGMVVYVLSAAKLPGGGSKRYVSFHSDGDGELCTCYADRVTGSFKSHSGLRPMASVVAWLDEEEHGSQSSESGAPGVGEP